MANICKLHNNCKKQPVPFLKIAHTMYIHNLIKISLISLWSGSNSLRNNGFISNLNILHLVIKKWQHCLVS